jgi:serine/threonine protein kinase
MFQPGAGAVMDGICGSPGYIAPEVCTKKPYGTKIDVFSIGVICYAMISGTLPFVGTDIEKKLEENVKCKLTFNHPTFEE